MTEMEQQEQGQQQTLSVAELHALIQLLGSSSIVMGAIVMVIGIGYLIVSYGLLKGREWAWTITVGTDHDINHSPNSIHYNNKHT